MDGLEERVEIITDGLAQVIDELEDMRVELYVLASPNTCYGGRLNGARPYILAAISELMNAHHVLQQEGELVGSPCGGSKPKPKKNLNVWGEEVDD
jgi:hypothetical protein